MIRGRPGERESKSNFQKHICFSIKLQRKHNNMMTTTTTKAAALSQQRHDNNNDDDDTAPTPTRQTK
eukprot:4473204-Amphidinium_carterae.1